MIIKKQQQNMSPTPMPGLEGVQALVEAFF